MSETVHTDLGVFSTGAYLEAEPPTVRAQLDSTCKRVQVEKASLAAAASITLAGTFNLFFLRALGPVSLRVQTSAGSDVTNTGWEGSILIPGVSSLTSVTVTNAGTEAVTVYYLTGSA